MAMEVQWRRIGTCRHILGFTYSQNGNAANRLRCLNKRKTTLKTNRIAFASCGSARATLEQRARPWSTTKIIIRQKTRDTLGETHRFTAPATRQT